MLKENLEKIKKSKIAKMLGITFIILLIFLAIAVQFKGIILWTVVIILATVFIVVIPIAVEIVIRKMADKGFFFIRAPENTALAIMRDRRLDTMLIAVPGEKRIDWQAFCDIKNRAAGREKFILMEKRGGLHYIGRPWVYKVYEWYEATTDKNINVHALHSVLLSETIISYLSADKDPEGVPNFESADPIEIRSSLTIYFLVKDPEKALFAVPYRKEAIKKQIFPIWKTVLSTLSFYEYATSKEGGSDAVKIKGEILQLSSQKLKVELGLLIKDGENFKKPDEYPKDSIVAMFEKEWGIWVRDVVVEDLEETGTEIRDALGKQLKAKANALALVEEAEGKKKAVILEAEGKKQANILEGEGSSKKLALIGEVLEKYPGVEGYTWKIKWNGETPTTVLGGEAMTLLNLTSKEKKVGGKKE